MNKKIIMFLLVIILCVTTITLSYAFITIKATTSNIITFGSLRMRLNQTTIKDGKEVAVEDSTSLDITGKTAIDRKVFIENLGNESMFVRIALDVIIDKENKKYDESNLLTFNINTSDWIYKDGWYYYKNVLKQGEATPILFTKIEFDENKITEEYQKGKIDLDIIAQAVQVANNKDNVLDAEGWPSK